ncbi:LacI family DNA-binding transcriptional regulator [Actinomyces sp. 186855]|nr:LacI family DNA-binding transcriptional regulator [Actinomyces sp. 186855]
MMPNLAEVAQRAKVSTATASLVLSGKDVGRVSRATAKRVLRAATEIGYVRNALAAGMRSGRTSCLGVVAEGVLSTPYAVDMIKAVLTAAAEHGWSVILNDTGDEGQRAHEAVQEMLSRQVDHVIQAAMYHRRVDVPSDLPDVVVLNGFADRPGVPCVVPDETRAAFEATEHLIALGHTRIAHITDTSGVVAVGLRLRGYRDALEAHAIAYDERRVIRGGDAPEQADASARRLLALRPRPTAVFCFNDGMAAGVYRQAYRAGLRIPEDLSVVGFDDLTLISTNLDPGLTTMRLPHYEMADWLTRAVINDGPGGLHSGITRMPCRMVHRGSTAPPLTA